MTTLDFANERRSPAYREWERQEQEREAARTAKAVLPLQDTLREIHRNCRAAWRTPLADLMAQFNSAQDNWLDSQFYIDLGLPEGDQSSDAVAAQYKVWYDALLSRTGWVISQSAEQKFKMFVRVQMHFGHVAVTVDSLDTIFQWMVNGVFEESEVGYDPSRKSQPVIEPTRPTFDDVLRTTDSTTGREAERHLRDAAESEAENELGDMVQQFWEHLRTVWGYAPTNADAKYLLSPIDGLFVRRNWALNDARSFDSARRVMVSEGRWNASLLTAGEVLDREFRRGNLTWSEYQYRLNRLTSQGLTNRPRNEVEGYEV